VEKSYLLRDPGLVVRALPAPIPDDEDAQRPVGSWPTRAPALAAPRRPARIGAPPRLRPGAPGPKPPSRWCSPPSPAGVARSKNKWHCGLWPSRPCTSTRRQVTWLGVLQALALGAGPKARRPMVLVNAARRRCRFRVNSGNNAAPHGTSKRAILLCVTRVKPTG
jgi:hypothetical protein